MARMIWTTLAVAFLLTCTLGRVHLKFSTEDLKTQHVRLQTLRRGLERQIVQLENRTSDCWDSQRLQEVLERREGRRFVGSSIAAVSATVVPSALREKYLDVEAGDRAVPPPPREKISARAVAGVMQLLEAGKAYAATHQ